MREIKFRAWSTLLKEMLNPGSKEEIEEYPEYGLTVSFDGRIYEKDNEGTSCLMDNLKLMQFTGLKDKNGKEIYEGDIVKLTTWRTCWETPSESIILIGSEECPFIGCEWLKGENNLDDYKQKEELEIIGNKFENPELLN